MCGFELHLRYDEMPLPRRRDKVIMELAMEMITDKEMLKSIAGVRGFLNVKFLSDVVTADGKFLEHFACKKSCYLIRSKFAFPKECPSDSDWESWRCFWSSRTVGNFELPSPLRDWVISSHIIWEWYIHDNGTTMYRSRADERYDKYVKRNDRSHRLHLDSTVKERERCSPISVKMLSKNCIRYSSTAALVCDEKDACDTFWDVLKEGGGEWMWEFVDTKSKGEDMDHRTTVGTLSAEVHFGKRNC